MALNVKDGLAMRLTHLGNRLALAAALMGAIPPATGCRSTPHIDQSAEVPHQPGQPGMKLAKEDAEVQTAQFLENAPLPLPRVAEPRTTSNPEAQEVWQLTLQEAIRIGLENAEVVRVIDLGAQGIPVSGFEPRQLAISSTGGSLAGGAAGLSASAAGAALGAGGLATVYGPAIQEASIARALSVFDATLSAQVNLARQVNPVNNSFTAGIFARGDRIPFISINEGFSPFGQTPTAGATLAKQIATGGQVSVSHNIFNNYTNSPNNVFPSYWATQTQLRFGQPLLGTSPTFGVSGVEANRADIVVARLNADFSVWEFKQNVMFLVRSIEQQYWVLAQQHMKLWAAQAAADLSLKLLDDVLARQEVGSMEGGREDVADARAQYERAQLSLVTTTSDVLTTERQLRNILGLPPSDNRRIIPVTEPTDARLEPNWEASLAQMVTFHPDIIQQQLNVRIAEMQLLVARNQLLPALDFNVLYQFNGFGQNLDTAEAVGTGAMLKAFDPLQVSRQTASGLNPLAAQYNNFQTWQVGFTFQMPLGFRSALSNTRTAQLNLLQQRAFLQQMVHQSTHQLARYFLEVDANYKQYKAASRLVAAQRERLDTYQARYEEGMRDRSRSAKAVDIRSYIDAINQWTNAVAQEAEYKSTYNTSIAVLEETKGTLLAYDNIAVAEGPWPRKAYIQARDQQAAHRQHPVGGDGPYHPRPSTGTVVPDPLPPNPPPDLGPPSPRPNLPFPAGPLGPAPLPSPPAVPTSDMNNILMDNREGDPTVRQASAGSETILPPLPATESAPPVSDTDPILPPIALPALPEE
jgi:outer membrane protein TolC